MTCTIDGCNGTAIGRGWCSMHYHRWRKWGDVHYIAPKGSDRKAKPDDVKCNVGECDRVASIDGLCRAHKQQAVKAVPRALPARVTPEPITCMFCEAARVAVKRGYDLTQAASAMHKPPSWLWQHLADHDRDALKGLAS